MKKFFSELKEMDYTIIKAMNQGFLFSLTIGILGVVLLLTYNTYAVSYDIFKGGFILIKTGFIFAAQCFGCGFVVDKLNKGKA